MDSNSTKLPIVHDQNVFPRFQEFSCWISMQCSSLVQYQEPTNLLLSKERLLHQPEFGFQLPCPSYQRVLSEARSLLNTVICHISLIWQKKNSPSPHNLTCCEPVFLLGVEHQSKSEVRKHLHFVKVTRQIPARQRQTCSILCTPTTVNCFSAHKDEGYDYSLLLPNISSCFWKYRVDSSKYSCGQWLIF